MQIKWTDKGKNKNIYLAYSETENHQLTDMVLSSLLYSYSGAVLLKLHDDTQVMWKMLRRTES